LIKYQLDSHANVTATQHKRDCNTDKHVYASCVSFSVFLSSNDYVVEQQYGTTG